MRVFDMDKIILNAIDYEIIYDELDTNCFNIIFEDGYFNIQSSVYIDPDFEYSEITYFELSRQENGRYLDPNKIIFQPKKIIIIFDKNEKFLNTIQEIHIIFPNEIKKELVEFFNNYLFLGKFIQYSSDFDKHKIVQQNLEREVIDWEEDIE